jgi:hypothetical protein
VLNHTTAPGVLLEVCFVDSAADCEAYAMHYGAICEAIAGVISDEDVKAVARMTFEGSCSWFGGPGDSGVDEDEGLAFFYEYGDAPHLFLYEQPPGTTGLARRLDPTKPYVACRWNYAVTPKTMLADRSLMAMVRSKKTGKSAYAWPADWGPHVDTNRAADLSPGLMEQLGLETDDEVEIIYPAVP